MIAYSELHNGVVFIWNGEPYQVMEANFMRKQQRKPVMQTKVKNLITGKVISQNFASSEQFEEANLTRIKSKFIYSHRDKFVFTEKDNPSKRFELSEEQVGETKKYLKANAEVAAIMFDDKFICIELPIKMQFKVTEAPPNIKGNTAQGGKKAATIETGAQVNVPLFIETGDEIVINTLTGEYDERVQ